MVASNDKQLVASTVQLLAYLKVGQLAVLLEEMWADQKVVQMAFLKVAQRVGLLAALKATQ